MLYPARLQSVHVTTANAAVRDLDVDIGLLPRLRLELSPLHLSLRRRRVKAQPSIEFVVG